MWRATPVELDFFAMEGSLSKEPNRSPQRSTINDIQKAMSRVDPQLLKAMFANVSLDQQPSVAATRTLPEEAGGFPTSPRSFKNPIGMKEEGKGLAPMTIFYSGDVSVFTVAPDEADMIFKRAEEFDIKKVESSTSSPGVSTCSSSGQDQGQTSQNPDFDLPIARRNSLKRFLEKRRDSLPSWSPYTLRRNSRGTKFCNGNKIF